MNNKKLIQTIIFAIAAIGFTVISYIIPNDITKETHAAIWFTTGGVIIAGALSYFVNSSENGFMDFATVSYIYTFLTIVGAIFELIFVLEIKWVVVIQLVLFIFYIVFALIQMGNKKEKTTYKKAG